MTIALAGRRIDAAGARMASFPLANADWVRSQLRQLFKEHRPAALVTSAACGSDLLALDEAGALGIRRRVILPFAPELFRESSVVDRPGEWGALYDRIIQDVSAAEDLVVLGVVPNSKDAYLATNRAILAGAEEIAGAGAGVTAVLVWDNRPRGTDDLTEAFRSEAQQRGYAIRIIPTL
ncbi:MAG: hypothetical protein JO211_15085 [Acidobacteriaceae bacterium]|nr:hypothetical protein [Acidobacteriaceae bacterium]